jgi:hypothetical protein
VLVSDLCWKPTFPAEVSHGFPHTLFTNHSQLAACHLFWSLTGYRLRDIPWKNKQQKAAFSVMCKHWYKPRMELCNLVVNMFLAIFQLIFICRFRWPCALRRKCAITRMLRSRVRIPLKAWMFLSCVCCVLCRQCPQWRADHSVREVLPGVCVCICVYLCVIIYDKETSKRGGLGLIWAIVPPEKSTS